MTLDQTIADLREQARTTFYFGDYSHSAHLAQMADWLEELKESRALVKFLVNSRKENDDV